jgi:hypothetical protein
MAEIEVVPDGPQRERPSIAVSDDAVLVLGLGFTAAPS